MNDITADGASGVSFIHPMGEIFLHPLAGETQNDTLQSCNDVGDFNVTETGQAQAGKTK